MCSCRISFEKLREMHRIAIVDCRLDIDWWHLRPCNELSNGEDDVLSTATPTNVPWCWDGCAASWTHAVEIHNANAFQRKQLTQLHTASLTQTSVAKCALILWYLKKTTTNTTKNRKHPTRMRIEHPQQCQCDRAASSTREYSRVIDYDVTRLIKKTFDIKRSSSSIS